MQTELIVLAALLIAFASGCVWLLLDRGTRKSRLALTQRDLEEAARRVAVLEADIERSRADAEVQLARADGLDIERATLVTELNAERRAREQAGVAAEELRAREIAAFRTSEEQHRAELEKRLGQAEERFRNVFGNLAGESLGRSTRQLVQLAEQQLGKQHAEQRQSLEKLVSPITETLRRADTKLADLEKQRVEAQAKLIEQISLLGERSGALGEETRRLSAALRKPQVRGRYGEIQLERVAELAGMTPYCDFDTQSSASDADGSRQRPDMVVRLPNSRVIAVDAKTNIEPYLDAIEADDSAEQAEHLARFARGVLEQAQALARKSYWSNYEGAPEFCVMFIPGDQFIDAAFEREPKLLELAAESSILLASPSTLIGLLRAVAVGWREKRLTDSAHELLALGRELHDRSAQVFRYTSEVGKHLDRCVNAYNTLVGSLDTRLLPTLRRFEDEGAKSAKELVEAKRLRVAARSPSAPLPEAGRSSVGGESPSAPDDRDGSQSSPPPAATAR